MDQINDNFLAVKKFLDDEQIEYKENKYDKKFGIMIDIWIAKYRIAIRKSQADDQEYYKKIWKKYKPFFVRPNETVEFSIEKIRNCIDERVKWLENFKLKCKRRAEFLKKEKEKKQAQMRQRAVKIVPGSKPKRKRIRIQKPISAAEPLLVGGFNLKK